MKLVILDKGSFESLPNSSKKRLTNHTKKMFDVLSLAYYKTENVEFLSSKEYWGENENQILNENDVIEMHCYSFSEYKIKKFPNSNAIKIVSAGHDKDKVRFPGAESNVISIALNQERHDVYDALTTSLCDFYVDKVTFDVLGEKVVGTSPACAYFGGVLANELEKHEELEKDIYSSKLILLNHSDVSGQKFILNPNYKCNTTHQYYNIDTSRAKRIKIDFLSTSDMDSIIDMILEPKNNDFGWFQDEIDITVKGAEYIRNNDKLRVINPSSKFSVEFKGKFESIRLSTESQVIEVLRIEKDPILNADDKVVLGVSASHDASACLMINGKIINAIQLERLSRIKRDGSVSLNSDTLIKYCLQDYGISLEDVDHFGFNIQSLTPGYIGLNSPICSDDFQSFCPFDEKSVFVSHHLAHALSAYTGSMFDSAKVVVADGSGGVTLGADDLILSGPQLREYVNCNAAGERPLLHTFSVYNFNRDGYELLNREYSPSFNVRSGSASLGEAYASVSNFVFGSWHASGKLMGLSPYGNRIDTSIVYENESGIKNFDYKWKLNAKKTSGVLGMADLAASVQYGLEEAVYSRFEKYELSQDNVVFCGGIALNSVLNAKLRDKYKIENFYLFPAQHDAGISIGAAVAAHYFNSGRILNNAYNNDYLGHRYNIQDVYYAINRYSKRLNIEKCDSSLIAQRLASGEVIGYFSLSKGSEFGPRALGARSILADPRSKETWLYINDRIKYREEFRPFAPIVVEESASKYFSIKAPAPYMLEVVKVRSCYQDKLEAITHVDGTARLQTVSMDQNSEIYDILKEFESLTTYPILLNTSFNVRGQPIVENPVQAIEMLLSSQLDAVVFDEFYLSVKSMRDSLSYTLSLSPGTKLCSEINDDRNRYYLDVKHQGRSIELSKERYLTLLNLSNSIFTSSTTCEFLKSLITLRILNIGELV
ncbi:hypothetical protein OGE23_002132 [Vibrio cholerae]|nr:hypothetical protein [Vibrio cholerae]EJY4340677.1 hypothetical protein [Vibrio cholerae]